MHKSVGATDIDALKKELKTWERNFREQHGREINKDDVRRNPEIDAKYKLYKELNSKKSSKSSLPIATASAGPSSTGTEDVATPSTPQRPRKSVGKANKPIASIFPKKLAEESSAPIQSSNPFSPSKQRNVSPAKPTAGGANPFYVSSERSSGGSSKASASAEHDNPFARASSTSTIFTSPTKSVSKSSAPPVAAPFSASASAPVPALSNTYEYAGSPKKLQALIVSAQATIRDTPRTKARKRLRGEEVAVTPSEKRRRVAQRMTEVRGLGTSDDEEEEEEIGLTPVKPPVGVKAFKPIFDDFEQPIAATSFFTKASAARPFPSKRASPSSQQPPSKIFGSSQAEARPIKSFPSFVVPTKDDPFVEAGERSEGEKESKKKATPDEGSSSTKGRNVRAKRGHTEALAEGLVQKPGKGNSQSTLSNAFGLHPPSPPSKQSRGFKGKAKGKWADRKKPKLAMSEDDNNSDEHPEVAMEQDGEDEGVREVEWRSYGPLLPNQNGPSTREDEDEDEEWLDSTDRYRLRKPRQRSESPTEDEKVEVSLPEEMKRVLVIESPDKVKRVKSEKEVVKGLMAGEDVLQRMQGAAVWGAGDVDEEEEDNDWVSEPEGWVGTVEM